VPNNTVTPVVYFTSRDFNYSTGSYILYRQYLDANNNVWEPVQCVWDGCAGYLLEGTSFPTPGNNNNGTHPTFIRDFCFDPDDGSGVMLDLIEDAVSAPTTGQIFGQPANNINQPVYVVDNTIMPTSNNGMNGSPNVGVMTTNNNTATVYGSNDGGFTWFNADGNNNGIGNNATGPPPTAYVFGRPNKVSGYFMTYPSFGASQVGIAVYNGSAWTTIPGNGGRGQFTPSTPPNINDSSGIILQALPSGNIIMLVVLAGEIWACGTGYSNPGTAVQLTSTSGTAVLIDAVVNSPYNYCHLIYKDGSNVTHYLNFLFDNDGSGIPQITSVSADYSFSPTLDPRRLILYPVGVSAEGQLWLICGPISNYPSSGDENYVFAMVSNSQFGPTSGFPPITWSFQAINPYVQNVGIIKAGLGVNNGNTTIIVINTAPILYTGPLS
jgi:hypothetical protein